MKDLIKTILLVSLLYNNSIYAQTTHRQHYSGLREIDYNIMSELDWGQSTEVLITSDEGFVLTTGFTVNANTTIPVTFKPGKAPAELDDNKNWTLSLLLDENGEVYSGSKSFFNAEGQNIQNQSLLVEDGDILVSQPIYDQFGRAAIQTLSAPINAEGFVYKSQFISHQGTAYNASNFKGSKEFNPDAVDNVQKGTLGWYYSQNNNSEPLVDASQIPYNRVKYYKYKSGEVEKAAEVGEAFQLGSGRESYSRTIGSYDLPDTYITLYNNHVKPSASAIITKDDYLVTETTNVGSDGKFSKAYSDPEGKVLVTSIKNSQIINKKHYIPTKKLYEVDFHQRFSFSIVELEIILNTSVTYKIYSNRGNGFSEVDPTLYKVFSNRIIFERDLNKNYNYRIISEEPFKVNYIVNLASGTGGYQLAAGSEDGSIYRDSKISGTHLFFPECASNIELHSYSGFSSFDVYDITRDLKYENVHYTTLLDLLSYKNEYIISQVAYNTNLQPYITYTSCEGNESYNYYNTAGQLIVSITPKGVQEFKTGIPYNQIDKTTYTYNNRGFLVSTTSNDAGTSNYKYAKDGRIRFSQNEEQAGRGRPAFSYTDYDEIGRPIESGEYVGFWDDLNNLQFSELDVLLEDRGPNPWADNYQVDWIRTYYDVPAGTLPLSNEVGSQRFVNGNVSWTQNDNSATYYSYDDLGRVEWMVQTNDYLDEPKKVEYTYDFLGNVLEVAYQADKTDAFYHHYEYDKSKRLKKVYTSLNGTTKNLQATYHYYLHGQLKRVELGDKNQGIDYVYNINGMLKSINSPDNSLDPGKDGNNEFASDVFGAFYKYFHGDYNRNNEILSFSNQNNLNANQGNSIAEQFNGNIAQILSDGNNGNPLNAKYTYDQRNQLVGASIIPYNVGSSSESYVLDNIDYDPNGNIKSLRRSTGSGTLHNFNYAYRANKNQLGSVTDAVGPNRAYQYNPIGQMTNQSGAFTQSISYNAMGLVKGINTPGGNASYTYDDRGFRLRNANSVAANNETIYIRDATGNVLSIYQKSGASYVQAEVPIYGASRLGSYQKSNANRTVYELKDHLGNVRAVIDRNKNASGDPIVYQSTDYWPFGMVMRSTINGEKYRYGYQGEYAEDETEETGYNSFQLRLYDPIIGRWFAPDPYGQYPSPYVGMGNEPVNGIDPDGGYSSPIFGLNGKFLGVDSEGYNGNIIVMDESEYNLYTNNGESVLDHGLAQMLAEGGHDGASFIQNAPLSYESLSKIYTHVLSQMSDINISGLYNGHVSIYNNRSSGGVAQGYNSPSFVGRYNADINARKVSVNINYKNELTSVEIIQNYIGIHEWKGHVIEKFKGPTHYKAYELQKGHHTFDKLPMSLQNEVSARITDPFYRR